MPFETIVDEFEAIVARFTIHTIGLLRQSHCVGEKVTPPSKHQWPHSCCAVVILILLLLITSIPQGYGHSSAIERQGPSARKQNSSYIPLRIHILLFVNGLLQSRMVMVPRHDTDGLGVAGGRLLGARSTGVVLVLKGKKIPETKVLLWIYSCHLLSLINLLSNNDYSSVITLSMEQELCYQTQSMLGSSGWGWGWRIS